MTDPSPSVDLARARIDGQEDLLAYVGRDIQGAIDVKEEEQESVLMSVVRRMVLDAQTAIQNQQSYLETIAFGMGSNGGRRIAAQDAQLLALSHGIATSRRTFRRRGQSLAHGYYCLLDPIKGIYCVKQESDEATIPETDLIVAGPFGGQDEASRLCEAKASGDSETADVPETFGEVGATSEVSFGGPAPFTQIPPVATGTQPTMQPELPFRPKPPQTTPSQACPVVPADEPDIGHFDFLTLDGFMGVLGLPAVDPRRRFAREFWGPPWFPVFDAVDAGQLGNALAIFQTEEPAPFAQGPRPGSAERLSISAMPGD
ncbi:MAG: hypothetical protein ACRD1X_01620 [Vicinamibacteria bacterium]